MDFNERLGYLLLGCLIGFILGYIARSLREIKKELDEVAEGMKHDRDDESGFVRNPIVLDVALLLVVVLTVWASFASQKASNAIQDTQDDLQLVTMCNQQFLAKTLGALDERTTYTKEQATTNVELQKAQAQFIRVILKPHPDNSNDGEKALKKYFDKLTEFVFVNSQTAQKVEQNPFPTNNELSACLHPNLEGKSNG